MASVWRWHDPFVVCFVKSLVDFRVMKASVDPVDEEIGEENEKRELDIVVQRKRSFVKPVVELRIAFDLKDEAERSQDSHTRH